MIFHHKGSAYQYPPSILYLPRYRVINTTGVRSFLLLLRAIRKRSKYFRMDKKHKASGPPENIYDLHPVFPRYSSKPAKLRRFLTHLGKLCSKLFCRCFIKAEVREGKSSECSISDVNLCRSYCRD